MSASPEQIAHQIVRAYHEDAYGVLFVVVERDAAGKPRGWEPAHPNPGTPFKDDLLVLAQAYLSAVAGGAG